ncbi:ECF transporter S component [Paenibacillus agilis]|uniref:ECF transporter S component n=1 Tax=Paenibacillus agilis TaxID=3020863 RepID=A0A559IXL1_9BACL|nr:ECF transporter S component [Paenibacillus agilis]TVX92353.1 ECF transporter S component [Paenibacillus agilis]
MQAVNTGFQRIVASPLIRDICIAISLSALSIFGRILTNQFHMPNIQPSTAIIMIASITLGMRYGIAVAVATALGSNIALGHGPWTMWQICAWGSVAIAVSFLKPVYKKLPIYVLVGCAALTGYLYGFIVSSPVWAAGPQAFWLYYQAGLLFDTFHAVGNAAFMGMLAPILLRAVHKVKL